MAGLGPLPFRSLRHRAWAPLAITIKLILEMNMCFHPCIHRIPQASQLASKLSKMSFKLGLLELT